MPKGQRKDTRSTQEKDLQTKLDAIRAKVKGQKDGATDSQKEEIKKLSAAIKPHKFVRIGNKRIPRALAAIKGIAALGNYGGTEKQHKAIVAALREAVDHAEQKLSGKVEAAVGFTLPVD